MKAHYIIFHPERQKVNATVKVLRSNLVYEEDKEIFVDTIKYGNENEDPFIFSNPWLYSFCRAPNLRRAPHPTNAFVQPGSCLIFADYNLFVDTIIFVDKALVWPIKGKIPPADYSNRRDCVWFRHIRHGLIPNRSHNGEYTYEAIMYSIDKEAFSYLPFKNKQRPSIQINNLSKSLIDKIEKKLKQKRKPPVLLEEDELRNVLNDIEDNTIDKVIEIIGLTNILPASTSQNSKNSKGNC